MVQINTTYRVICAVAKHKKMSAAAEVLHLSPSAVSHAVTAVERQFGFPIFIRKREGILLTTEGKELLPYAERVVAEEDRLQAKLMDITSHANVQKLRIGAINSVCCSWLPDIINRYRNKNPHIEVSVFEGSYAACETELSEGRLDCALVHYPVKKAGLVCKELYNDPIVCITSKDWHPEHDYVSFDELKEQSILCADEVFIYDIEKSVSGNESVFATDHSVEDDTSTITLVEKGFGLGILPELVVNSIPGNVNKYPIEGNPYRTIAFAVREYHEEEKKLQDAFKITSAVVKSYSNQKEQR